MFVLRFTFPAGRYHATPWGRHVNEGAVAWPPEPWRLLRALIAVHHRKPGPDGGRDDLLSDLVEALAAQPPVYRLPPAVHAHTRHYMPQGTLKDGREETSLVFDAFHRLQAGAELLAIWPDLVLRPDLFAFAACLAENLGYLGRSESLVEAAALDALDDFTMQEETLAHPIPTDDGAALLPPGFELADVLVPLSAAAYARALPDLKNQAGRLPKKAERDRALACLPDRLVDALRVDTAMLQAAGWSRPPASATLRYQRPRVGPSAPAAANHRRAAKAGPGPTTALFLLAGTPLPPITETLAVAELLRAALMHRYTCLTSRPVPSVLSGRDAEGRPLRQAAHPHAFFLPQANGKGQIDRLVLHAAGGLDAEVLRACESLTRLWIGDARRHGENPPNDRGRQEWRVALARAGEAEDFPDSALLRQSRHWISMTPYLRPRYDDGADRQTLCERQIRREAAARELGVIEQVALAEGEGRLVSNRNALTFRRFRSRRGLRQPDRTGTGLVITFTQAIRGPVALGFGAHFGLGLFAAHGDDDSTSDPNER